MIFRVMVVDDEAPIRAWIVSMLNSMPKYFQVCAQARDGEEALKKFEAAKPDLVFLDVQMPKLNGLQLLEKLKKISPETEVIILSNYDDFMYVRTSFRDGVAEYLLKSEFDRNKLLTIYETLQQRKNQIKIAHIHQTIRNQFVYKLLNGKDMDKEALQSLLKEYEIDLMDREVAGIEVYIPENHNADEILSKVGTLIWDEPIHHVNIFLVSHPLRLIILFNLKVVSAAERDRVYRECVREIKDKLRLPVGSTQVRSGLVHIQKIIKECDEAVIKQWAQKTGLNSKRAEAGLRMNGNENFYEIDMLYKEISGQICRRECGKVAELLSLLLEEIRSLRTFYPIQMNALLVELYCDFCQAIETRGSLHDRLSLEDEAKKCIASSSHAELMEIMMGLERRYESSVSGVSDITKKVVKYINENYSEISSMQEIADELNYNVDYLYRRFKQEMGMSFVGFLTKIRLEKAAEMMRYGNVEPSQAAEKVGYSSVSYFNKKFKELYGYMPVTWKRKQH